MKELSLEVSCAARVYYYTITTFYLTYDVVPKITRRVICGVDLRRRAGLIAGSRPARALHRRSTFYLFYTTRRWIRRAQRASDPTRRDVDQARRSARLIQLRRDPKLTRNAEPKTTIDHT